MYLVSFLIISFSFSKIQYCKARLTPLKATSFNLSIFKLFHWYFADSYDIIHFKIDKNHDLKDELRKMATIKPFYQFKSTYLVQIKNKTNADLIVTLERPAIEILETLKQYRKILLIIKTPNITTSFKHSLFGLKTKNILLLSYSQTKKWKVNLFDPFTNQTKQYGSEKVKEISDFFSKPPNYNGIEVKSTLFESKPTTVLSESEEFSGIDPMVIKVVGEKLNISFKHYIPCLKCDFYGSVRNGQVSGALGELFLNKSDIAFNSAFIKDYGVPNLEFSPVVFTDIVCVFVPKSLLMPPFNAYFSSMSNKMQILGIILVIIFGSAVLGFITHKSRKHKDYERLFFVMFQIIFNNKQINTRFLHERIFVGTIFVFSVIQTTIFQSVLVDLTTNPRFYPDINNLEQLAERNVKITTYSSSLANIFNTSIQHDFMEKLQKNLLVLPRTNTTRYFAALTRKTTFDYYGLVEKHKYGFRKSHLVPQCPQTFLLAYLMRKNVFFKNDFNDVLERVIEGGFVGKWYRDHFRNFTYELPVNLTGIRSFPAAFSLDRFKYAIFLLFFGLGFSFMVFIVEVIVRFKFFKFKTVKT